MIGLDAIKAAAAPWLGWIKWGAVAIVLAGLAYWHLEAVKDAKKAGMEAQQAIYNAAYIKETNEAKESAEEVRRLNEKSRAALVAGRDADADRLRKQFAAARMPAVTVCAGTAGNLRASPEPKPSDSGEAGSYDRIDRASAEAIASLSAELRVCGETVRAVADKLK